MECLQSYAYKASSMAGFKQAITFYESTLAVCCSFWALRARNRVEKRERASREWRRQSAVISWSPLLQYFLAYCLKFNEPQPKHTRRQSKKESNREREKERRSKCRNLKVATRRETKTKARSFVEAKHKRNSMATSRSSSPSLSRSLADSFQV